jgi:ATP-dependent protease ClpP protease subunit
MSKPKDNIKRIPIVGAIISGRSYSSDWYETVTGCDTVKSQIGSEGDIQVYMNSQGGSVFAGFEILNALSAAVVAGRKVDIYISAMAASIASYISSGVKGATVHVAPNAKLMFHAPWTCACGSREEFLDVADMLSKMEQDLKEAITSRGATFDEKWFSAVRMKWFNATEAVKAKLADVVELPPSDLIAAVHKAAESSYNESDIYDKADVDNKNKNVGSELFGKDQFMRIAASMEFEGYILSLCQEKFGEDRVKSIAIRDSESFEIVFNDDSKSLLNYQKDALNIVNIKWKSDGSTTTTENNMSTPKDPKDVTPTNGVTPPDGMVAPETPKDGFIEGQTPPVATVVKPTVVQDEPPSKAGLPEGLTEDMIAFAKIGYAKARNEHIESIKANKENDFSDEELANMSIATLEKLSKIANAAKEIVTSAPKADNSIVQPPSKTKASVGTLPPPEL